MSMHEHTLHQRLQEYCSCFLGTDTKGELLRLCKGGESSDITGDLAEASIKLLGLLVLHGLQESASSVQLCKEPDGRTRIDVRAKGHYQLPGPPPHLAERALEIMRSIMHMESGTQRLVLGLSQDSVEILVSLGGEGGETLDLQFPG